MQEVQFGQRTVSAQLRRAPQSPSWLARNLEQMELLGQHFRRGMLRTFPFSHFRGRDYRARLAALAEVSTGNNKVEENILADLRGDGASFAMRQDLIPLLGPGGGELIHSLAESVRSRIFGRDRQFLGNEAMLSAFPGVWRLGLSSRMLDMAEAYLGLSCFYLGATVKRAMPGLRAAASSSEAVGQIKSPRQWHLDLEDERVFRVLIYLSPVDASEGPFEFVPRLASQSVEMQAHYRSGQIPDTRMKKIVARSTRKVAYGEAGDGVLFDGAQIFHRNRQPLKGERYSITFAYCSRHPLALDPRRRLSHAANERVALTLSARQRDCLPPPRRL